MYAHTEAYYLMMLLEGMDVQIMAHIFLVSQKGQLLLPTWLYCDSIGGGIYYSLSKAC